MFRYLIINKYIMQEGKYTQSKAPSHSQTQQQFKPLQKYDAIYVTGFNTFGGASYNPTEIAFKTIKADRLPGLSFQLLDYSVRAVKRYIQTTKQRLLQFQRKDERILHLHLGVNLGGQQYTLQKRGINLMTFDLKNSQGSFSQGQVIEMGAPLELRTLLDVQSLKEKLNNEFYIKASSEPKDYICNYLYYKSLYEIQRNFHRNHSLFVNFTDRYNQDEHKKFIKNLISTLRWEREGENKKVVEITRGLGSSAQPMDLVGTMSKGTIMKQQKYDQIFLTGFKKFGKLSFNATEIMVKMIGESIPGVTCEAVDCSMSQSIIYINKMKTLMQGKKDKCVLHLHLGMGERGYYNLERYSYNLTKFEGYADNDKIKREKGAVIQGGKQRLETFVEIVRLKERLQTKMKETLGEQYLPKGIQVKISNDPGRFICNYIYYLSIYYLSCDLQRQSINHDSLFVHVPTRQEGEQDGYAPIDMACIQGLIDIMLKKKGNLRSE